MEVRPHPGAGVEILGVDLADLDDATFGAIRDQFVAHGLVFFRDQQLTEADHIAFAERLGTINVNRFFPHHDAFPQIATVVKEPRHRGNVGGAWHTDHSYDAEPALGSVLVARELPTSGGDTWFVSTTDAFDRLPGRMKDRLRGMRAVHSAKHVFGSRGAWLRLLIGSTEQYGNPDAADALDDAEHPVVIRHPLSGREALYVNPAFTVRFADRGMLRSLPLLLRLYRHATRSAHVARFRWAPGSVAVWDNRSTWHYAQNDYPGQRRVMHRITLDGCALEAARPMPPAGR